MAGVRYQCVHARERAVERQELRLRCGISKQMTLPHIPPTRKKLRSPVFLPLRGKDSQHGRHVGTFIIVRIEILFLVDRART